MVAKHSIIASINSRKFPNLAYEIEEFKANPQNNFSEFVNTAIKKELDFRRPKIESYIFDDGKQQTQLDVDMPSIWDLDKWFDKECQEKLKKLNEKELFKLQHTVYIVLDVIKDHIHRRGFGRYDDTLRQVRERIEKEGIESLLPPTPPPPAAPPSKTTLEVDTS
jgi:hypothetical protein